LTKFVQHLKTTNDTNGNPRRLWAVYRLASTGNFFVWDQVFNEGYGGKPEELRRYIELPEIYITPSEYNSLRKSNFVPLEK
jgi:hypothetical protein